MTSSETISTPLVRHELPRYQAYPAFLSDYSAKNAQRLVEWLATTEPEELCYQLVAFTMRHAHTAWYIFLAAGYHGHNGRAGAELYLAQAQERDYAAYAEYFRYGLKLARATVPLAHRFACEDSLLEVRLTRVPPRFADMGLMREALWTEDDEALSPLLSRIEPTSHWWKKLWDWAEHATRCFAHAGIPAPKLEWLKLSTPYGLRPEWAQLWGQLALQKVIA